jgi:uncharacterized protein YjbJ (UPF0337 family)
MTWSPIEGRWEFVKAHAKAEWGRLTDMDILAIAGKRDRLIARISERYGVTPAQVESDVEEWATRMRAKIEGLERPRGP